MSTCSKQLLLTAVVAACCLGPPLHAVTLDRAVALALQNNPDLRAATFEVEKARGRLIQAGLWPNPELEFDAANDRAFRNEGEHTRGAGFQQAFPVAGRLRRAKQVSRVELAQAMAEVRNRERLLIGEVQRDFLTVLLLRQQLAANRALAGASKEFVDVLEARLARAEVSQIDVHLAQLERQRLEMDIATLGADLAERELALKRRMGLAPEDPLAVQGDLETLLARFSPEQYSAAMVVNRPDLRQAELGIDRAAAELRLARAEAWGDWTLGASYEQDRSDNQASGLETDRFLGLKLSIPVALWNRNQGRVFEQKAAGAQAAAQFDALQRSVRSEIATAIARARRLRDVVGQSRKLARESLGETDDLIRRGYAEGLLSAAQVIQVRQQQAGLRNGYLTTAASYLQALVDLETATASSRHLKKDFLHSRTSDQPATPYTK